MLFCLGAGAQNILCALCVFGAMHVLAYGLE
jgi:LSD1 subclass zinc finger protein